MALDCLFLVFEFENDTISTLLNVYHYENRFTYIRLKTIALRSIIGWRFLQLDLKKDITSNSSIRNCMIYIYICIFSFNVIVIGFNWKKCA